MLCARCKSDLPLEDFNRNQAACRSCQKEYYKANIDRHKANVKKRRDNLKREQRALIAELKSKPCADCGLCYPECAMDFDHISGVKTNHVSCMIGGPTSALLAEVAKCEVVCSNCHRVRTHKKPASVA